MNRRDFLLTGGVATTLTLAGCLRDEIDIPEEDQINDLPRPTLGDPDSDIVVKVFEDYSCPGCGQYNRQLFPLIKDEYIDTGDIAYEYYDYPLPVDLESRPTANVARYVQDTVSGDAFWDFKEVIYYNQDDVHSDFLVETATDLGADEDGADYARHGVYDPVIDADKAHGESLGVPATPSLFVNGDRIETVDWDTISRVLDSRLEN